MSGFHFSTLLSHCIPQFPLGTSEEKLSLELVRFYTECVPQFPFLPAPAALPYPMQTPRVEPPLRQGRQNLISVKHKHLPHPQLQLQLQPVPAAGGSGSALPGLPMSPG